MERLFDERSWRRVDFTDEADAYVVNTCTVTDRADSDARNLARRARRRNPRARVVLTGCYAQTSPSAISELDYVDYVIGLGRLPDLLRAVEGELSDSVAVSDLRHASTVDTLGIESFSGRTRAFVKIQEGCNLFCTYCIVPVARGRSRSVPAREILTEIDRLEARGFREVVLTGVHLGGYGKDLDDRFDLAWLLEAIAEHAPGLRIRISSVDPPEITERLVDVVASNELFCPHFHVPLQAGVDAVLEKMGRQYTSAEAAERLAMLRERIPDVSIGTDVITGFPGESEDEFVRGIEYIERAGVNYLHVFPYSERTSTSAAKRWQPLDDHTVHERARILRGRDKLLRRRFEDGFLGTRRRVLFENARDGSSRLLKGYSENYLPVLLDGPDSLMNRIVDVELAARKGRRLLARTAAPHGRAASRAKRAAAVSP
jgi:threonylcarbamoyladenosine tRNA methylthiotransferase MtaB